MINFSLSTICTQKITQIPRLKLVVVVIGVISLTAFACSSHPDLIAIENLTDGSLSVVITEVPNDKPLESGESRRTTIPFDTMYETQLLEITDDTSALMEISDPTGFVVCEYLGTDDEQAVRLLVRSNGCSIEPRSP